jgi:hypothetical protein
MNMWSPIPFDLTMTIQTREQNATPSTDHVFILSQPDCEGPQMDSRVSYFVMDEEALAKLQLRTGSPAAGVSSPIVLYVAVEVC